MLLIHAIDVPKLDELREQIAKNGKKGTLKVTKYPRRASHTSSVVAALYFSAML
jgi:hypothetical protein